MTVGKIVAIVDDQQDIATLFHDVLMSISDITILTFTDPIAALEHFQTNADAYVLVISDYKMPGLNGMELLRKMKDLNHFLRTIITTGFLIEDNRFQQYVKKKIINASLQKPIKIHDLLLEVNTQLQSYEMQKRFPSELKHENQ